MNIENRSGTSLKNCVSILMIVSFSLICVLGLIAIIKAAIDISFTYAFLIIVICCICLFFVYFSSLLLYAFGELVENSATIVNILKTAPSKEAVAIPENTSNLTPHASITLDYSTSTETESNKPTSAAPQVEEYDPNSWLCACGKRNDPSQSYCPACGRVPKR